MLKINVGVAEKTAITNKNIRIKGIMSVLLFVIISTFAMSGVAETKPQKTGTHNYLGTDGRWHYVKTYRYNETGTTWSEEWVGGDGPTIHTPATLPNLDLLGGNTYTIRNHTPL